jgi:hypothetical protein
MYLMLSDTVLLRRLIRHAKLYRCRQRQPPGTPYAREIRQMKDTKLIGEGCLSDLLCPMCDQPTYRHIPAVRVIDPALAVEIFLALGFRRRSSTIGIDTIMCGDLLAQSGIALLQG